MTSGNTDRSNKGLHPTSIPLVLQGGGRMVTSNKGVAEWKPPASPVASR